MNRARDFDNILDECLEGLLNRGETLEQCLARYPEQAEELKPLLETALIAKGTAAIQPRPEFQARAVYQLRAALREVKPKRGFFFLALPRWATAVAVFLVLVLLSGGTVAAADDSLPDETLYPVKLATERVRVAFTFSDIGKAELYAELADRRVAEIASMANKGDAEAVDRATSQMEGHLVMIATLTRAQAVDEGAGVMLAPAAEPTPVPEPAPEPSPAPSLVPPAESGDNVPDYARDGELDRLRTLLARYAVNHPGRLRELLRIAPESAKPALRRAIAIAEARYAQALETVNEQSEGR